MELTQINSFIANLPLEIQKKIRKIYKIKIKKSQLVFPENFPSGIINDKNLFKKQTIVEIKNIISGEGALFNLSRSKRPLPIFQEDLYTKLYPEDQKNCPFCQGENATPQDPWGRLKGKHAFSCSNLSKYDSLHGMIIWHKHKLWDLQENELREGFHLSFTYLKKVVEEEKLSTPYFFLMWNGRFRGGASLEHPHLHLLIRESPYPKIEKLYTLQRLFLEREKTGYISYLLDIYKNLKLLIQFNSTCVFPYLTPIRNGEIWFLNSSYHKLVEDFIPVFLKLHQKALLPSFNLAFYFPPPTSQGDFPYILRIIERGPVNLLPSDISGMGIFAGMDVAFLDPYFIFEKLQEIKRELCH